MAEKQNRPVRLTGDNHDSRRELRRQRNRLNGSRRRGPAVRVCALSMLGLAMILAVAARAQDTPVKNETSGKTDAPREAAPESPSREPASAEALSLHYRFIERYSATEDPNHPELLTQYRVGLLETQKTEREKQQGAPERFQVSHTTIYTERAAQASKMGELISAVRRYDRFQMKDMPNARAPKLPFFEGLTIWYKLQPGRRPFVLNLTDARPLREFEYSRLTTQVFLPRLTALLPPTPPLVGDTWPIPASAAHSLVGEIPSADDYAMTGSLIEVRKAASGPALTAVIGISGQMNLSYGPSSLNAQIQFIFSPVAPVPPSAGSGATSKPGDRPAGKGGHRPEEGIVNARGYISRVLMAWKATNLLPDEEGRLKQTRTYELQLERRLASAPNGPGGGQKASLPVPQPIPTPTEANSWLLYQDPQDRFYLTHPQNLELSPGMVDPNVLELVEQDPGAGKDVFILSLAPGAADPQTDRQFRDVQQFQHDIDSDWLKNKREALRGPAGWLPEADWSPWKVFRKELGVRTGAAGAAEKGKPVERIYCDYYLVLSKRNECFHVQSMTVRDDHVAFRTESEGIIKSFHFGKWDPQAKAPTAAPTTTPVTPAQ